MKPRKGPWDTPESVRPLLTAFKVGAATSDEQGEDAATILEAELYKVMPEYFAQNDCPTFELAMSSKHGEFVLVYMDNGDEVHFYDDDTFAVIKDEIEGEWS